MYIKDLIAWGALLIVLVFVVIIIFELRKIRKIERTAFDKPIGTIIIALDVDDHKLYPFIEFDSETSAHDVLTAKEATFRIRVENSNNA